MTYIYIQSLILLICTYYEYEEISRLEGRDVALLAANYKSMI